MTSIKNNAHARHALSLSVKGRGGDEASFYLLLSSLDERLATCRDGVELAKCRTETERALRKAQSTRASEDVKRLASQLNLLAMRRLGQVLAGRVRGRGRPSIESHGLFSLQELGLDRRRWQECRQLALFPDAEFENVRQRGHLSVRHLTRKALPNRSAFEQAQAELDSWVLRTMRKTIAVHDYQQLAESLRRAANAMEVKA
jgi:hypothetical protein